MVPPRPLTGWTIVASTTVIQTPFLTLRRDDVELPGGERIEGYYVRESRGYSVIFAITPDDRIVLVRQYKHGIGEVLLELPAGGIDPGETAQDCARRELAEETGYIGNPAEPELVASLIADPTNANFRYHVYLVRGARPLLTQDLDLTEAIDVELATFEELRRYVRDGTIAVGSQLAAVYRVLDHLGRL